MDVYVSPEMGQRLRGQREFLGLPPGVAAQGMRNRGHLEFTGAEAIEEFERGDLMSYLSLLNQFANLYRCSLLYLLRGAQDRPASERDLQGLSPHDAEMVLRFQDFLARSGRPPAGTGQ